MRIIAGTHKGRGIHAPKNLPVRPTTDFAKESIFNILNNHFEFDGLRVMDLFCGTGNMTYEFASRGCGDIVSVDSNFHCCEFVKRTSAAFKMDQVHVIKSDVFAFLKRPNAPAHIIFCDPPYEMENIALIPELVFFNDLLKPQGWLVIEHGPNTDLSKLRYFSEHRKYGNVNFSIFERKPENT